MTQKLKSSLNRWLASEHGNRNEAAEIELFRVFRQIPMPRPPFDFADKVLLRAGLTQLPVVETARPLVYAMRIALSLALLLGAAALAVIPGVVLPVIQLLSPQKILEMGIDLTADVFHRLAASVAIWRALAGFGESVAQLVQSPTGLAAMAIGFSVSAGIVRALAVLMTPERRGSYVSYV